MTHLARLTRFATLALPAAALALAPAALAPAVAQAADISMPDPSVERSADRIILRDTRKVVQGTILEVTDELIKMKVIVAGISATRSYKRANIISYEFGTPAMAGAMPDTMMDDKDLSSKDKDEQTKVYDDTTKLYSVELKGNFGTHVSQTPIKEMFEDVDQTFDDLVWDDRTRTYVVDPKVRQQHIVVIKINNRADDEGSGDGVFRAEDMYPIIEQERIKKGRRVVFWVEYATGGAVFMALSSPEVYFTKNASMFFGERFDLEEYSFGDEMVQEKQISLRMGHMIGAARVGGYDDAHLIVPAMTRSRNWLSMRQEGGKTILTDKVPPDDSWLDPEDKNQWRYDGHVWAVLSDNGEGEFDDDESSIYINDMLFLDFNLASKLGISDGLAETIEDIAVHLGVEDNYVAWEETGGQDAIDDWSDGIERYLDRVSRDQTQFGRTRGTLWREMQKIEVAGDWKERSAARGKQIRLHKERITWFTRFSEAFDANGAQRSRIRQQIDQIKLQIADDPKPQPTRRSRRR